jgi:hypothetical protein
MSDEKGAERFKITVEGDGLKLDRSIDESRAREIINILMGGAAAPPPGTPRIEPLQGPLNAASGQPGVRLSLREFLNIAQAANWPAKITAIGVYLQDHEGQADFTREDVRARFRHAGEGQPGNYHRDFAVAVGNGWVAEDSRKPGSHYVTNTGRQAVESKFAGEVKRASTPVRRKSRGGAAGGGDDVAGAA